MEERQLLASAAIFSIRDNIKSTQETVLKKKIDKARELKAQRGSDSESEEEVSSKKSLDSSTLELRNEIPDI